MSGVRVGTSWRGRKPGTRHWVSMPLSTLVLGYVMYITLWMLIGLPVLGLWLTAQVLLLAGSVVVFTAHVLSGEDADPHARWHRGRFGLWYWE